MRSFTNFLEVLFWQILRFCGVMAWALLLLSLPLLPCIFHAFPMHSTHVHAFFTHSPRILHAFSMHSMHVMHSPCMHSMHLPCTFHACCTCIFLHFMHAHTPSFGHTWPKKFLGKVRLFLGFFLAYSLPTKWWFFICFPMKYLSCQGKRFQWWTSSAP